MNKLLIKLLNSGLDHSKFAYVDKSDNKGHYLLMITNQNINAKDIYEIYTMAVQEEDDETKYDISIITIDGKLVINIWCARQESRPYTA
jgi:hypothetical protein